MNKSFAFLWGATVVLILFFWIYFPTLSRYRDFKMEQENSAGEVKTRETKIRELQEEKRLLKDDREYIEKVIREELGLVKPGEIVYKLVPDNAPHPQPEPPAKMEEKSAAENAPPPPKLIQANLPSHPAPLTGEPLYPRQETR